MLDMLVLPLLNWNYIGVATLLAIAAIAVMAADYLVDRGFAHYGFCAPGDLEFARLRFDAFRDRLSERGFSCSFCNTINNDIIDWLRSLPKPVAILGGNDDVDVLGLERDHADLLVRNFQQLGQVRVA